MQKYENSCDFEIINNMRIGVKSCSFMKFIPYIVVLIKLFH